MLKKLLLSVVLAFAAIGSNVLAATDDIEDVNGPSFRIGNQTIFENKTFVMPSGAHLLVYDHDITSNLEPQISNVIHLQAEIAKGNKENIDLLMMGKTIVTGNLDMIYGVEEGNVIVGDMVVGEFEASQGSISLTDFHFVHLGVLYQGRFVIITYGNGEGFMAMYPVN